MQRLSDNINKLIIECKAWCGLATVLEFWKYWLRIRYISTSPWKSILHSSCLKFPLIFEKSSVYKYFRNPKITYFGILEVILEVKHKAHCIIVTWTCSLHENMSLSHQISNQKMVKNIFHQFSIDMLIGGKIMETLLPIFFV